MQLQGTDKWFEDRLGKFTASKIHLLEACGKSGKIQQGLETYIQECVAELITGEWQELSMPALDWGKKQEPIAISTFEFYYEKLVEDCPFIPWGEHSGGSPDGAILEDKAVIEVKCPYRTANHAKHIDLKDQEDYKKKLKEYYAQLQWNMHITDSVKGYFISYDPRVKENSLHVIEVEPDDETVQNILKGLEIAVVEKDRLYKEIVGEIFS